LDEIKEPPFDDFDELTEEQMNEMDKEWENQQNWKEEIPGKKKSKEQILLIGITFAIVAVVIGSITITYFGGFNDELEIDLNDLVFNMTENDLVITVADYPPSALYLRERDYVSEHMDTYSPKIETFPEVVYWAKRNSTDIELKHIESEILQGAILNNNTISIGEKVFLQMINWVINPDSCDDEYLQETCQFFDISYQQHRYQLQEITRDEYWLEVKQYASQEVIDEVEGSDSG